MSSGRPGTDAAPTRAPLTLDVLAESLSVLRFPADAAVPEWALRGDTFASVTRTGDELSLVCATAQVPSTPLPDNMARDDGWRALKVAGPFAKVPNRTSPSPRPVSASVVIEATAATALDMPR